MNYLSRFILSLFKPIVAIYDSLYHDNFKTFIVKRGKHRSCIRFKPVLIEDAMAFTVRFNFTARYKTVDPLNQYDINKLWGFSEYLFSPKKNSARVGWNYRDGILYLRPYTHVNGVMSMDPPEVPVQIDKDISCLIIVQKEEYIFYLNDQRIKMPRNPGPSSFMGVQLYPYFGGDEAAPQTISFQIKA